MSISEPNFQLNDPVKLTTATGEKLEGVIAFVGDGQPDNIVTLLSQDSEDEDLTLLGDETDGAKIGIRLTGPSIGQGEHDGIVHGREFFVCPPKCGILIEAQDAERLNLRKRRLNTIEEMRLRRELAGSPTTLSRQPSSTAQPQDEEKPREWLSVPMIDQLPSIVSLEKVRTPRTRPSRSREIFRDHRHGGHSHDDDDDESSGGSSSSSRRLRMMSTESLDFSSNSLEQPTSEERVSHRRAFRNKQAELSRRRAALMVRRETSELKALKQQGSSETAGSRMPVEKLEQPGQVLLGLICCGEYFFCLVKPSSSSQ